MKLSIHTKIKGKPVLVTENENKYLTSNGERVNLGYDWMNVELEWPEVFELITKDGIATSAELSGDHRSEADFVSRELIMIDIDEGMTLEDLATDEFYQNWSAGFYTTPSHKWDAHRFRILFRTENPITDPQRVRNLINGLMLLYKQADTACKDASRIFYGCVNSECCDCTENVLTEEIIELIISSYVKHVEETKPVYDPVEYKELDDQQRKTIIDLLHKTFVGEYSTWRNIGWGLKTGGFSLADFQYVTTGMMNQKSAKDAENIWRDGRQTEQGVTMGSVFHLLKQHHGKNPFVVDNSNFGITELGNKFLKRKKL